MYQPSFKYLTPGIDLPGDGGMLFCGSMASLNASNYTLIGPGPDEVLAISVDVAILCA